MSLLDAKDYNTEFQSIILNILTSEPEIYTRCQNILKPEYFDQKFRSAVEYILQYTTNNPILPTRIDVKMKSGYQLEEVSGIQPEHHEPFLVDIESFCRHKALELAIIQGMKLVQEKRYGAVESLVKEAVMVSLQKDIGTDYFADPATRTRALADSQGTIATGWTDVDAALFGGFGTGELEIFVAKSGGGKSVALQNLSLNFAKRRMNGAYISLELKEELVANRMDAMLTGRTKRDIFCDIENSALDVQIRGKEMGAIYIKRLPETITTVNDIRVYLKELRIRTGIKLDYIAVDYLDLLSTPRAESSDVFNKDKFVCEELRALAHELDIVVITAAQLNRSADEEKSYSHSNIAGGISKIYTADNVIAVYTTDLMKEQNLMEFQFMKTRNSSGVGKKVSLHYSVDTLKISDLVAGQITSKQKISKQSQPVAANVPNSLHDMLAKINNTDCNG